MVYDVDAFLDRREAGQLLARELMHLAGENPLVLALPRGGVPLAIEVARALNTDLDLLFVRKLGAPGHEELGLGAIVDGANPQIVLNDEIVRQLEPSANYMRAETRRQLAEIDRRRQRYMGDRLPIAIGGRTVIVVDDGIATGGTMKAALRALHKSGARWIVLAVPVAPPEVIAEMRAECDEIVCLRQPMPFGAVGAHYVNFDQLTDEEVMQLLDCARAI